MNTQVGGESGRIPGTYVAYQQRHGGHRQRREEVDEDGGGETVRERASER
jgi:hypothetical protein